MFTAYCTWSEEQQECRGRGTDPLHPPGRGEGGGEGKGGVPSAYCTWSEGQILFTRLGGERGVERGVGRGRRACLLPTVPGARNNKSAEDEGQILFTRLGGGEG